LFLLLAGFSILKIEKVTVKPGRSTWGIGAVLSILGLLFVALSDPWGIEKIVDAPTATPIPTSFPTTLPLSAVFETPTTRPSPTSAKFSDKYALLAEASAWPITESESFDDPDPVWLSYEGHKDQLSIHQQKIEAGRLLWEMESLVDNLWYWHNTPYYSYWDFYLSFKFKRDPGVENYATYGLMFRKEGDKFYTFRMDDGQRFAVQLYEYGNWTDIIGWKKIEQIKLGKFNELTVIADGPNMDFFINGVFVGAAYDESLSNGQVSFTIGTSKAGPEVIFEFDDFELREKP
jgi:hypothetical protein